MTDPKGLRNKVIAQNLFISETSVKNHLRSFFNKIHIGRRSKPADLLKQFPQNPPFGGCAQHRNSV